MLPCKSLLRIPEEEDASIKYLSIHHYQKKETYWDGRDFFHARKTGKPKQDTKNLGVSRFPPHRTKRTVFSPKTALGGDQAKLGGHGFVKP